LTALAQLAFRSPRVFAKLLKNMHCSHQAYQYAKSYPYHQGDGSKPSPQNPLWDYFQKKQKGNGIWKWQHYFEIYHKHLQKFVGKKVSIMEIGVYSGGSLEMWRSYFGENCQIYGIDIEPACKNYENEYTSIFIGDQQSRSFWQDVKRQIPHVDIVIDDGGHMAEQQRITLEETLPIMNPGGVFICEDIHGDFNRFAAFAATLASELHNKSTSSPFCGEVSSFQNAIHSIHFYPYVVVMEKNLHAISEFTSHKHGEKWQPFL